MFSSNIHWHENKEEEEKTIWKSMFNLWRRRKKTKTPKKENSLRFFFRMSTRRDVGETTAADDAPCTPRCQMSNFSRHRHSDWSTNRRIEIRFVFILHRSSTSSISLFVIFVKAHVSLFIVRWTYQKKKFVKQCSISFVSSICFILTNSVRLLSSKTFVDIAKIQCASFNHVKE